MIDITPIQRLLDFLNHIPLFWIVVSFVQDILISVISAGPIPKHVGFIMDGNRRFASRKALPLKDGHSAGALSLMTILETCYRIGITHVTVYAFSLENFNRSPAEVETLMALLRDKLSQLIAHEDSFIRLNQIKVQIVGNRSRIPLDILSDLERVEHVTDIHPSQKVLYVCFPYTSRDDMASAVRSVCHKSSSTSLSKADINEKLLNDSMYMGPNCPQLDILIRTSGHTRLSDFMLWQCTKNCMVEFIKPLWPDFKFLALILVLIKWSFIEQERTKPHKKPKVNMATEMKVDLYALPTPPPFGVVSSN